MTASYSNWKIFGLNLWQQVVVAMILAIIAGLILNEHALCLKIFGDIFIKLIKMIVAPLIFFALITGITSLAEGRHFKRIAMKGTIAYILTSMLAAVAGLFLASFFPPGVGISPPSTNGGDLSSAPVSTTTSLGDFLMSLIPHNIVSAMADDLYLQIVVFAVFTGIVINSIRGETDKVKQLSAEIARIMFKMIEWVVRTSPLAVFGFIAAMVGTTGTDVIMALLKLVSLVIAACALQYCLFGLILYLFGRISPMPFYKKMVSTQLMAFSTSSSKATLTMAMRELQNKMGVSKSTSNFMMPLGACINMDGTAIYLGICAVFFSQLYGIPLHFHDYIMLMLTCTLGSIGAAGMPSGSILFMGMVLHSVGLPFEGVAMLLGVDRILDMFRTTVNITGDAAITLLVDKTEGTLNESVYYG